MHVFINLKYNSLIKYWAFLLNLIVSTLFIDVLTFLDSTRESARKVVSCIFRFKNQLPFLMQFYPNSESLQKHIDYYWIVEQTRQVFGELTNFYAFPGVTPDLIIVLDGYYTITDRGKQKCYTESMLFAFLPHKVAVDFSTLKSFILVKFKSRALSSLKPFITLPPAELIQQPVLDAATIFGTNMPDFIKYLKLLKPEQIADALDGWFAKFYLREREGFIVDIAEEVSDDFDINTIRKHTSFSYSTLERYFKSETGLTPKKYQSLRRYKSVVEELCRTKNEDWFYYVTKYGYYDQSHFIREITKYTGFTPKMLIQEPIFALYRPY